MASLLDDRSIAALEILVRSDAVSEIERDAIRAALHVAERGATYRRRARRLLRAAHAAEQLLTLQGAIISNGSVLGRLQAAIHEAEGT